MPEAGITEERVAKVVAYMVAEFPGLWCHGTCDVCEADGRVALVLLTSGARAYLCPDDVVSGVMLDQVAL